MTVKLSLSPLSSSHFGQWVVSVVISFSALLVLDPSLLYFVNASSEQLVRVDVVVENSVSVTAALTTSPSKLVENYSETDAELDETVTDKYLEDSDEDPDDDAGKDSGEDSADEDSEDDDVSVVDVSVVEFHDVEVMVVVVVVVAGGTVRL